MCFEDAAAVRGASEAESGMNLSPWCLCLLCVCVGCAQQGPRREILAPASAPASAGVTQPAQSLKQRQGIEGFVAFCQGHGLAMRPDVGDADSYFISTPLARGFRVEVSFRAFASGTSAAEMQKALQEIQLAFYPNEDAGLAMSDLWMIGEPDMPADATESVSGLSAQLIQLFRDYHPQGAGLPRAHPATTQATQDVSTVAFVDYCNRHGLKLAWADGAAGCYSVPPASAQDFELMVCFVTFPQGTKASKMDEMMPWGIPLPFENEAAGLVMRQPGLRSSGPMPVAAYKRSGVQL